MHTTALDLRAAPGYDPRLPPALLDGYAKMLSGIGRDDYRRYLTLARAEIDPRPHAELGTPLLLPADQVDAIGALCRAMISLLRSPTYRARFADTPGVLGPGARTPRDDFGSIDLHLGDDGPRIIEVHCSAPGGIATVAPLARAARAAFTGVEPLPQNLDFDRALATVASRGTPGRRIAIAVSHLPGSATYFKDYRALVAQFAALGFDAGLELARDVTVRDGRPAWGDRIYDEVLSLVIPLAWARVPDEFAGFGSAWSAAPSRFFPHPWGWDLTTKRMLPMLRALDRWAPALSAADRAALQTASLPAAPMDAFASVDALVEAFGPPEAIVAKPYDGYHGVGVRVQPDRATLDAVFAEARADHVVQGFYPGHRVPLMAPDGTVSWADVRLRALYLEDGMIALMALTNPPGTRWVMPVAVC